MNNEKFKIGDKVILKSDDSDSIAMIVRNYFKNEKNYEEASLMGASNNADLKDIKCCWRDKDGKLWEAYFPEDGLSLAE